jgi:hypothetical protein
MTQQLFAFDPFHGSESGEQRDLYCDMARLLLNSRKRQSVETMKEKPGRWCRVALLHVVYTTATSPTGCATRAG